mmetsp:Transcript_44333/g.140977  ORF Transcript_44333/g.140977 Transcript_44333/m.140977 type:complete len:244 (+) Transcript_44333:573-1304(+)
MVCRLAGGTNNLARRPSSSAMLAWTLIKRFSPERSSAIVVNCSVPTSSFSFSNCCAGTCESNKEKLIGLKRGQEPASRLLLPAADMRTPKRLQVIRLCMDEREEAVAATCSRPFSGRVCAEKPSSKDRAESKPSSIAPAKPCGSLTNANSTSATLATKLFTNILTNRTTKPVSASPSPSPLPACTRRRRSTSKLRSWAARVCTDLRRSSRRSCRSSSVDRSVLSPTCSTCAQTRSKVTWTWPV